MKQSSKRALKILFLICTVSLGVVISLYFASDNIVFFIKPSELKDSHIAQKIRVGGLVAKNSVIKRPDLVTQFDITDDIKTLTIIYKGILPTLFREGQGIVAEGVIFDMDSGVLKADMLLTKHDENYKPPSINSSYNGKK